jgi:hypothetical protein
MLHAVHCKLYRRNDCISSGDYASEHQKPRDGMPERKKLLKLLAKKVADRSFPWLAENRWDRLQCLHFMQPIIISDL